MKAQSRAEIRRLLERHGLQPRKALGQHFLADPNIVDRIIGAAGLTPDSRVVEIGAGTGTLTRGLAAAAGRVVAYEIDPGLQPVLDEVLVGTGVEVRIGDVLALDLDAELEGDGWVMVANLPYNVGTPVLLDALRHAPSIVRFVIMLQKEVVSRLVANPGDPAYGIPSVVVGLHARTVSTFRVPPQVFVPPPAVDSTVLVLDRIDAEPEFERAIELASAGFGQRRKMLRSSLKSIITDPTECLIGAGIDPVRRAETVTPAEWVELARVAP